MKDTIIIDVEKTRQQILERRPLTTTEKVLKIVKEKPGITQGDMCKDLQIFRHGFFEEVIRRLTLEKKIRWEPKVDAQNRLVKSYFLTDLSAQFSETQLTYSTQFDHLTRFLLQYN